MKDLALAYAGVIQSCQLVRQIADTGDAETEPLAVCIQTLFRFDAESVEAVFGDAQSLRPGLRTLAMQLAGGKAARDPNLSRLARSVMHVEHSYSKDRDCRERVRSGLEQAAPQCEHLGPTHPALLGRLGELYATTISELRPRIMVQGNPVYLQQPAVVAEIRAMLLCALRSAVLWRQVGGNQWDPYLRRAQMLAAVREWLDRSDR